MSVAEAGKIERARQLYFQVWSVIGILLLLYLAAWVLGRISTALVPFLLALVIVVLLRSPVAWLVDRGLPRTASVAICYIAAMLLVTLSLVYIVPVFVQQTAEFITALPGYIDRAYQLWLQATEPKGTAIVPSWVTTAMLNVKDTVVSSLGRWSAEGLSIAWAAGSSVIAALFSIILAAIVGFYTLVDMPKLREETLSLVPRRYREESQAVTATVSRILGGWMRAAFIDSIVVGALMAIGLAIAGVPYSLVIGILGGVLNIVPYFGPTIAALLAALAGFFVSPWTALWGVVVIIVVQQFDSLWLNPRIMSQNVDLHPVLVVFSLLTGATLFGVPGMLLAVPVAAIVKGLFVYFYERRTRRSLRTEDGALFKAPKPGEDGEPEDEASPAHAD